MEEELKKKIDRKEALRKTGKYAAFTAAATMLLLMPKSSQAQSPVSSPSAPGSGSGGHAF